MTSEIHQTQSHQRTMRAITYERYGSPDVLQLTETEVPSPVEDQVVVEVHASSVNAAEWHLVTGEPYLVRAQMGLTKPKNPRVGADMAGVVAAVGPDVTLFEIGDEVFGDGAGAYAEYGIVREKGLAKKPGGVSFEEAAAVPIAGLTALQGLRDVGGLRPGQKVLINGASGGVGTYAVQLAKALGASHVTAVCSTRNVDKARSLGADHVIDYTKDDFTLAGERYDVILDIAATRPWSEISRALASDGTYVMVGGPKGKWLGPLPHMAALKMATLFGDENVGFFIAKADGDDLTYLGELLEAGQIQSVIERTVPLEEVPDALRDQGEGHARGKTVVTIR